MKDTVEVVFRFDIRPTDPEAIEGIVRSTGFFHEHEIPVARELAEERLTKGPECGYHFIFAETEGVIVSYSCFGPIPCTNGSFDLYWIVTHNDYRGSGIGAEVLRETICKVKEMKGRLLIAETATKDQYLPTRKFYEKNEFTCEAIINDFYEPGDGKAMYIYRIS
jgi:ribosomal protein S18 acetylase RimI-like enzyme